MLQFNFEMWNWLLGPLRRVCFFLRGEIQNPLVIRSFTSVEFLSDTASLGAILKWVIARLFWIWNFKGRNCSFACRSAQGIVFSCLLCLSKRPFISDRWQLLNRTTYFAHFACLPVCLMQFYGKKSSILLHIPRVYRTAEAQDWGLLTVGPQLSDVNVENHLSCRQHLLFNLLIKYCWKSCFMLNYPGALTLLYII